MKRILLGLLIGVVLSCSKDDESCVEATARITAEYQVYLDRNAESNATEEAKAKQRSELIKERDKKIADACN